MNERIDAIIAAKGMKKTEFAQKLNVSQAYVSQLCSGTKSPSDRTISDICRVFDVNEGWLRTGEGEMFVPISRSQEIADFVGDVLKGEEDTFKRRFIAMLARLDENDWKYLEEKAIELVEDKHEAIFG